ncbi:MAG: hypothetical protein VZR09_02910 [Candidatus Gastranaerophilaceae bacterium]|nr:hypothetical protein [Candidatus Gastranaerophilaceae bacterium]
MPSAVMHQHSIMKAGTCPHGAPLGACPICNGMGGAGSMKKADHTAKPGEMSWNECAAIGAMLRAQKAAKAQHQQDAVSFAQRVAMFEKNMMNISQKLADISGVFTQNFPPIIAKPVSFVLNNIIGGTINLLKNIPAAIQNFAQSISQKFVEISDKLAAVYGEVKAALAKKIGEPLNEFKKKIKSLFSIFSPQDAQNEDKKVDEAKKAFRLKTFIHDLYKRIKGESGETQEGLSDELHTV